MSKLWFVAGQHYTSRAYMCHYHQSAIHSIKLSCFNCSILFASSLAIKISFEHEQMLFFLEICFYIMYKQYMMLLHYVQAVHDVLNTC